MLKVTVLFVLGLILICLGGDRLVDAAVAIAKRLKIPEMVVGATIVSLGTTLPEVLVSTTAALQGTPGAADISAGNAFGSIICNTALIAGLTQLISPAKKVARSSITWRAAVFFAISLGLIAVGLFTGQFNRVTGIVLLVCACAYAVANVKFPGGEDEEEKKEEKQSSLAVQLLTLVVCAVLLYFGANLLVDNGIILAGALGVPERVIAVTFIALGTSLPELVTSLASIIKGYGNVGLGNIVGANILNLVLVMGIPAAITGISLNPSTIRVDAVLGVVVMAVLTVPLMIKQRSYRIQGGALLAIYVGYVVSSFVAG
ncbi:MAG: calcium/sodium antiporter [Butyrivibrio sp.]|nr:calcium/sodium antiporter [Acetatifactor muris]MCM1558671.1 calcium/sodium antiporter [Butyrivibrio sp.]